MTSFTTHYKQYGHVRNGWIDYIASVAEITIKKCKIEKEEKIETPEENKINGGLNGADPGKYTTYGHHQAISSALGLLFLGG